MYRPCVSCKSLRQKANCFGTEGTSYSPARVEVFDHMTPRQGASTGYSDACGGGPSRGEMSNTCRSQDPGRRKRRSDNRQAARSQACHATHYSFLPILISHSFAVITLYVLSTFLWVMHVSSLLFFIYAYQRENCLFLFSNK